MKKIIWSSKIAKVNLSYLPPGTPSRSEQKIYERFIKRLKGNENAKVLILGSTPELRDLCQKHQVSYICVDYHPKNFYILKKKMRYSGHERLIVADWRIMNLKNKFDLVLGDVALAMIPFSDWDKMLSHLKNILKDTGFIVHRTWMRKKGEFKNFEQYLRKYHTKRKKYLRPLFASLGIPTAFYLYDEKRERVELSKNIFKLKKFVEMGLLSENDFYEGIWSIWKDYKLPICFPAKKKFEIKIKKFFQIKKIMSGRNWFKNYAPIYILKK